ncbi:MAG: 3-keto-disaccharide hydrolase [Lentimonas sp.]
MKKITLFPLACLVLSLATHAHQISEDQLIFVKKYEKQKSIIPAEEALLNTDAEPDLTDGFVDLYNGENLEGWEPIGGTCLFEANGDMITGTCVPGSPSTYLSTKKTDYKDFIFTVEMKWDVDGNSGVMFRTGRTQGKKGETVRGPQIEMEGFESHEGKRGWSGGVYGQGYAAWIYPLWLDAHKDARAALKPGEWNRLTIHAEGETVKTWVNGVPAAHWVDGQFLEGFFGLQVHAGRKGKIHFRNIKVRDLGAALEWEDLFATGDFSNWTNPKGGPVGKGWSIEDGVIFRGDKAWSLNTKKKYKDFELRFEWKISEAGNSGIKYRAYESLGLEYQILDDEKHYDRQKPSHRAGSLYALVPAPDDKPLKPAGEWNTGRIVANGDHIEHWLNGVKIVEIEYGTDDWFERFNKSKYKKHKDFGNWEGSIHLQDHNDDAWFRNVMIREL